ncbi:hypothetical protein [Spiroplasma endosymbiont of Othius punctulatus]|uniref:hypothetical protein n=1 Tax=Spiroplasma endosymbiont of Othius punctulatus TaxID=3066289 RepID=UPI0030CAF96E
MAKKPGSWKKLNELTGKVRIIPRNNKMKIGIFSSVFLLSAAAFTTTAYFFVTDVVNYNGIKTHGQLPNWNFKKGNGFEVDFAKTPMNHITDDQVAFVRVVHEAQDGHVKYETVEATSLRLQYAYNDIFERAPIDFIAENPIYGSTFSDASQIEVVDIYTDVNLTNKLDINDVQSNNFNVANSVLFLKINYKGEPIKNALLMPTLFYGNDGFLSNFMQFKLLNNMHKKNEDGTYPNNQSSILGEQSSKLLLEIEGKDSKGNAKNTDKLYDSYEKLFNLFFEENKNDSSKGIDNKEFSDYTSNPYDNFVISGVNKNDKFIKEKNSKLDLKEFDSTSQLFDINQLFSIGTTSNRVEDISNRAGNIDTIKFLTPFVTFLKNIYVQSDGDFFIPKEFLSDNSGNWTWWNAIEVLYTSLESKDKLNRYTTTQDDDQYYFMFLPEEGFLQKSLSKLKDDIHRIINNALTGNGQDVSGLLIDAFNRIKKDIVKKGTHSKYWWLFDFDFLPFQSYWTSESYDYSLVEKDRIQQNVSSGNSGSYIYIDKPELHEVVKTDSTYDLSTGLGITSLFTDLWSASTIFDDNDGDLELNTLTFSKGSIGEKEIFEELVKNTHTFLTSISEKVNISSMPASETAWEMIIKNGFDFARTDFGLTIPLDKFNKPIVDENGEIHSVDIAGELKDTTGVPKHLQKITFRFNIKWID